MITISLKTKPSMSHLLLKDTFDQFSFIEGEITTFNKFTIDGYLQKDFFEEKPEDTHAHWKDVREFCFQIIRGKRTPLSFKIYSVTGTGELLRISKRTQRYRFPTGRHSRDVFESLI